MDKSFADLNSVQGTLYEVVDSSDILPNMKIDKSESEISVLEVIEDPFEVNIHAVCLCSDCEMAFVKMCELFSAAGWICCLRCSV